MPLFQSGRPGATPGWRTSFRPRGSNRSGTRLLNGIDAGAIPAGGSTFFAPHAEAVEAIACKPVLTRCESGAALHFSPRDVTDSMRGFEPRRQGATPCVETNFGRCTGRANRDSLLVRSGRETGLGSMSSAFRSFSPCSPTVEASDLKSDKCGCESRRGDSLLPRKQRQRCSRFVIGRAGRKSLAWLHFLRMM